jgi:serine-type D-Ala-D-Ala carboxypeptidase (penicillin-binding protein 5/6)
MSGWRIAAIGVVSALASSAILLAIAPGNAVDTSDHHAQSAPGRTDPPAVTTLVSISVVPGVLAPFGWPAHGQAAVAVRGIGIVASSPREHPVPIASLTKMMTALIVLKDHPLAAHARGPLLAVTETDVADYANDIGLDDSTLKVALGEHLDEHQLLEGLLLPSGDNIADLLARWDAGSTTAFVAKMNAEARALGLTQTHYVDASGVSPGSVSTAADQVVVESALMGFPAARLIVRMPSARLPIAGTIPNFNPAIGTDGIIGVKSGWTDEAGACLATAAYRTVGDSSVLVESVTLGQPGDLQAPALVDEALLGYATRVMEPYQFFPAGNSIRLQTGDESASFETVSTPTETVVWPGLTIKTEIATPARLPALMRQSSLVGTVIGNFEVLAPWGVIATAPTTLESLTNVAPTTSTATSVPQPTA